MPNGTSAPGNVLPPPLDQVRVSTSCARSVGAWSTVAVLRAPAGRFALATGPGQLTTRPSDPAVHTAREVLALPVAGAALGVDVGLGAGLGGALGAAAAVDVPKPSTAAVIAHATAH